MNTMPMATHLAVELTRRQFDPRAEPEFVHDPLRLPRLLLRPARAALAAALHAAARAIAPAPAPRLSSDGCRG